MYYYKGKPYFIILSPNLLPFYTGFLCACMWRISVYLSLTEHNFCGLKSITVKLVLKETLLSLGLSPLTSIVASVRILTPPDSCLHLTIYSFPEAAVKHHHELNSLKNNTRKWMQGHKKFSANLRGYIVRSCPKKFKLKQTKQKDQDNPTNSQHDLLFCSFREENCEVRHHLHPFGDFRLEVSSLLCFPDESDLVSLLLSPSSKPAVGHLTISFFFSNLWPLRLWSSISPDSAVSLP